MSFVVVVVVSVIIIKAYTFTCSVDNKSCLLLFILYFVINPLIYCNTKFYTEENTISKGVVGTWFLKQCLGNLQKI